MPKTIIAKENGVTIFHNYHGNEHANPTHLHVKGGGQKTKIGPQGKPVNGCNDLSPKQAKVVENNIQEIKKAIKTIQKWLRSLPK